MSAGTAIVILAGGRATRFPGKLACDAGGMPVLGRVYRNALATGLPVYVAGSAPLLPPLAAELGAPLLPDRWPGGGPLRAIVSCCERLEHERVFVLAGDAPNVTGDVFDALARAWADGDDAAVPAHDGRIEPLAALYRRRAAARSGRALVGSGDESVRALAERLHARHVPLTRAYFDNVNTPADLRRALASAR